MKEFSWRTRVYWEDTDAGGVVYYANYLRFMERARTEWLRTLGFCQRDLAHNHGVLFAVTRVRIDYRRPARLDDELSVTCEPRAVGAASVIFAQNIIACLRRPGRIRLNCPAPLIRPGRADRGGGAHCLPGRAHFPAAANCPIPVERLRGAGETLGCQLICRLSVWSCRPAFRCSWCWHCWPSPH